jgi:putative transposase
VKKTFTEAWVAAGGTERQVPPAQRGSRRRGVWQVKFWEHTIRDAADFKRHLDYIHLNPVKHGLAKRPRDWAWSSFRRWVEFGEYEPDWLGPTGLSRNVKHYWYDE